MKNITYLSPTSISLFYQNQEEFYLNYLSDNRPDKMPQTKPMSVGSSFDAHVKSYLHEHLFGKGKDPKFGLMALFEAQVESQNRDHAYEAGLYCFNKYKECGALSDLMLDLNNAIGEPRFELEVKGVINGYREGVTRQVGDITFLGKPDLFFINKSGAHVVLDWKVNGYYSPNTTSPMQGYIRLRDGKINKGHHKNAMVMMHNGVMINVAQYLEDCNKDWARQLSIYAWLLGEEIGGEFCVGIDQIVCKPAGERPEIRVAEHRTRVRREHQWQIFAQAQALWEIVHSDHIFREMSPEDSAARCKILDGIAAATKGDGSDNDAWFGKVSRQ